MQKPPNVNFEYKYGFSVPHAGVRKTKKGLDEGVVREISDIKQEPAWMRDFRLSSYREFLRKKMPNWGADLSGIHFNDITYFIRPSERGVRSWDEVPTSIRETYDRIGIPEAEKKFLAGVSAQFDSEVVYENVQKELEQQGVIFCDMDTGLKKYPELIKEYLGTLIPKGDNKFAALNSCVWSGGSFVYVPKGVHVKLPLQAYFRINAESFGQFERTLIIAEEGS